MGWSSFQSQAPRKGTAPAREQAAQDPGPGSPGPAGLALTWKRGAASPRGRGGALQCGVQTGVPEKLPHSHGWKSQGSPEQTSYKTAPRVQNQGRLLTSYLFPTEKNEN